MATWSWTEYLNTAGYGVSPHSSWSRYTATIKSSDTVSVRTIYNGGDSNATSVNYITAPNGSTTVNDPDPTTSDTGLDRTWTSSSFSDSDYHTRWYWFTANVTSPAQKSVRILVIPSSVGWSGVQASIEQNSAGNAVLSIPSAFQGYLTGTSTDTGDTLTSTEQTKDERFYWRITSSASSHTNASGFSASSGVITSPTNNGTVTISPTTSATPGTYYIKLYHYNVNGGTGAADTLLDTASFNVTQLASLDTNITLSSTSVSILDTASSYSLSLTGGGSNTIYYILNVSNFANGSNIDALRTGNDSRYIARTFTTASSRSFSTDGVTYTITNDLPSSGSSTFYLYAANGLGQNSTRLTTGDTQYTVSVVAQAPSVSATKQIIPNGFGMYSNPTGTTSGTIEYQWTTTGGGSGPNQNVNNSYGWNTTGNLSENAAVGAEWVGTTWSVQARATVDGGSTYVYSSSSSVTLPEYTVTAPNSIQEGQSGTFTVTSTNGLGPIYWQVTPTGEFSTSSGQVGSGSASSGTFTVTPTSDGTTEGNETATVKLYINNTFDNLNWLRVSDTFTITDPPATPTADTISGVTWSATNTANSNPTISWSGGSGGTVAAIGSTTNSLPSSSNSYWVTDANGTSPTTITVDSNGNSFVRGTTYYFWVRRSASVVSSSFSSTAPYIALNDTTITIYTPTDKNGTQLNLVSGVYEIPQSYGTTSADIIDIPFSDGGTYAQYRVLNDTTSQWVSTASVGGSGTFELVPTESGDLPPAGNTYVYSFSGRRPTTTGGDGTWQTVNSGATISIKRLSAVTYTVTANSTSVNEGATATWTITRSSAANVSESYTISGISSSDISSGSLTGSVNFSTNASQTVSITLASDSVTEGTETATLTLTSVTGTPSANISINDTSLGSSVTLEGGTANAYGLAIYNTSGTNKIIDDVSRIGTIVAEEDFDITNGSDTIFQGQDCSSIATTGVIIASWSGNKWLVPQITRLSGTSGVTISQNPDGASTGTGTAYLVRY